MYMKLNLWKVTIIIRELIHSWLFNLKYLKVFFAVVYFKSKIISEYCINTVIHLMTLNVKPLLSLLWQWNKKQFNVGAGSSLYDDWSRSTQVYVTAAASTREVSPLSGWENVIGGTGCVTCHPCISLFALSPLSLTATSLSGKPLRSKIDLKGNTKDSLKARGR